MTSVPPSPYLFSCDWGTSSFRLRLVQRAPFAILQEIRSDEGVQRLAGAEGARADVFQKLLERYRRQLARQSGLMLDKVPTLISGMASSTIGWRELPYAPAPVDVDGGDLVWAAVETSPLTVLISGVRTAHDVMRGEETEVLGLLAHPEYAELRTRAILVMPGTHTKLVRIAEGRLTDFVTHMTGELLMTLTAHSILRHDCAPVASCRMLTPETLAPFTDGVRAARTEPLTSLLFRVRTNHVLHGWEDTANTAYLHGVLIGAEMQALCATYADDWRVVICAGPRHARWYQAALAVLRPQAALTVVPEALMDIAAALGHVRLAQGLHL